VVLFVRRAGTGRAELLVVLGWGVGDGGKPPPRRLEGTSDIDPDQVSLPYICVLLIVTNAIVSSSLKLLCMRGWGCGLRRPEDKQNQYASASVFDLSINRGRLEIPE
jgi:hypothetical protein